MSGSFFDDLQAKQNIKYKENELDQKASDEKITISLRLTAENHRQAKIRASTKGVSLSAYIEKLIEADL